MPPRVVLLFITCIQHAVIVLTRPFNQFLLDLAIKNRAFRTRTTRQKES